MIERVFSAAIVWIVLCTIIGAGFMIVGPGAATIFAGAALGLCGASVHVASLLLGIRLRWWYAGILVAACTSVSLGVLIRGDFLEPALASILFAAFALVAYIVFPIAQWIAREPNAAR